MRVQEKLFQLDEARQERIQQEENKIQNEQKRVVSWIYDQYPHVDVNQDLSLQGGSSNGGCCASRAHHLVLTWPESDEWSKRERDLVNDLDALRQQASALWGEFVAAESQLADDIHQFVDGKKEKINKMSAQARQLFS